MSTTEPTPPPAVTAAVAATAAFNARINSKLQLLPLSTAAGDDDDDDEDDSRVLAGGGGIKRPRGLRRRNDSILVRNIHEKKEFLYIRQAGDYADWYRGIPPFAQRDYLYTM